MILFIVALLIISMINIRIAPKNGFFKDDYMNKNQTTAIKGIFAVLIIFLHSLSYIELKSNFLNNTYSILLHLLGQLLVTCFFFYSGYGIMESYKRNKNYFKSFPLNRILKTLISYDFVIVIYIIYNLIVGNSNSNWLPSLFALGSIGIGGWFVFAILVSYIIIYIGYLIFKSPKKITLFSFIMTLVYCIVVALVMKQKNLQYNYYINTIFCLPVGLLYSLYKDKIENFVFNNKHYYLTLFSVMASFVLVFAVQRFIIEDKEPLYLIYNLCSILFVFLIVLITMKVKISNPILLFLGKYSFGIYILQKLSMMIVSKNITTNPIIFTLLVLSMTILLSFLVFSGINTLWKIVFKKKTGIENNKCN